MERKSAGKLRIAIDGPAGAGKSTVAKAIARRLGILYVDTGAMYRAVAWLALNRRVDLSNNEAILDFIQSDELRISQSADGTMDIYVGQECITDQLRTPEVSNVVSALSARPAVRSVLTAWQRALGEHHNVVMDGRDIGTVVLPDAEVKVFLTADLSERAERRANEFQQQGVNISVSELASAIEARDVQDSTRQIAPLRQAADAHRIDSTGMSVDAVVDRILELVGGEA